VDPRRVVGNPIWAKAMHVSRDCRRIYGADVDKLWLRGEVLEVMVSRAEGAKRSSTLIKAKYPVGNGERVKIINISQLKKDDPNPPSPAPVMAAEAEIPAGSHKNLEQSSSTTRNTPNQVATTTRAEPGSVQTHGTSSTGSSQQPVAKCHGMEWYDSNTEAPTNGPFPRSPWKMLCQYTGKEFTPGCDTDKHNSLFRPIDFFMACFPKSQLSLMVEETNKGLQRHGRPKMTKGELLKWMGVLLLITRYEFGDRKEL
jgi:hypothetical protein